MMTYSPFRTYLDTNGLVTPDMRSTGNGVMYSAVAVALCDEPKFRSIIKDAVWCCMTDYGLRRASKTWQKNQQQAPDDYFGLGYLAKVLDRDLAAVILGIARRNWGCVNEQDGTWRFKSVIWRMPQLVAHLQFGAGETPGPVRMLFWVGSIFVALVKGEADSYRKAWLMCRAADEVNPTLDKIIVIWRRLFKWRTHSGGIGYVERELYGWDNLHPTVQRGWGEY